MFNDRYENYREALEGLPKNRNLVHFVDAGTGMAVAGGVSAASGLLGSLFGGGNDAAKSAASAQARAMYDALGTQSNMWLEYLKQSKPWRKAGNRAVTLLGGLYGLPGFEAVDRTDYLRNTPGYQFNMEEGVNALDRSGAARGNLFSGAQSKALTKYGQGLADNTYNNYLSNLTNLSNMGLTATTGLGNAGIQTAANMAPLYSALGNAQGMGYYAGQNSRNSLYNNLMGLGGLGLGYGLNYMGSPGSSTGAYSSPGSLPYGGGLSAPSWNASYGGSLNGGGSYADYLRNTAPSYF